jgi:predicted dinucleotide-binding enzyme
VIASEISDRIIEVMLSLLEEQVGIVGAGALGKAIASHVSRCGLRGLICNSRAPATLDSVVQGLGPTIRAVTLEEAVAPEIVVLAIPWARVPEMLERVPDWEGRIVIDTTHPPVTRDASEIVRGHRSAGERIAKLAPGAHLVRAFNTLPAAVLARPPAEAGGKRVIFYSGDNVRAKRKVAMLISRMGFAAIDLGSLAEGGRIQQPPGGALAMLNLVQLTLP